MYTGRYGLSIEAVPFSLQVVMLSPADAIGDPHRTTSALVARSSRGFGFLILLRRLYGNSNTIM